MDQSKDRNSWMMRLSNRFFEPFFYQTYTLTTPSRLPVKGCPPVKLNDRTKYETPMLALASHLEGVREAGMLDQYIEDLKEPTPKSKKTRDRKRGLHGVMKLMNAWKDSNKYESVRAVMTAVGAITSAPGPAVGTCNHAAGDRSSKRQKDSKRSSENGAVSEFV